MQVTQGQVVERVREDPGRDPGQGTDIEFAHAIAVHGPAAGGKQVARGHDGQIAAEPVPLLFGQGGDRGVVVADALGQLALLVLDALTGLGRADVPVAQIGYGADDQLRRILRVAEHQHFVFRVVWCAAADHVDMEFLEQLARGVEKGGRVVVAGDDDHMPAA